MPKPKFILDYKRYHALARQAAAEGCVLLKNDREALPLRRGERVSVFGRIAWSYYKSGTGSGGLVNTHYVTGILDALRQCEAVELNAELLKVYEDWIRENPYVRGEGWFGEPWCQEEMPVTPELVNEAAKNSDCAVIILGRTAGEDKDASDTPGSFQLTETERNLLRLVCGSFERSIVLLNVGGIIDMSWVAEFDPAAVMYVWQGGQEGGNGVCDVLTGAVCPCGHLSDTIADRIEHYPAADNFGDPHENIYREDIYVGYRYFETFAREQVLYPFGFGLSYTKFEREFRAFTRWDNEIMAYCFVTNTGECAGKDVVQLYVQKPQGELGNPKRMLVAFEKTKLLEPGEKVYVKLTFPMRLLASYDDSGRTGHKSCWVLEKGDYIFTLGSDVRSAEMAFCITIPETEVVQKLLEACSPTVKFKRLRPRITSEGTFKDWEDVPTRSYDLEARMAQRYIPDIPYKGRQGITVEDVYYGRAKREDFFSQFTDSELCCFVRGEGMSSPKATPGTAAAIGGVTDWARELGIPVGCFSDGPSGIRMDCGTKATSLPNGTALGCTWNVDLLEELFTCVGFEMRKFLIDCLLGPGINIHRHPLCGRNFEYFSEDPVLTGMLATAQLWGLHTAGVRGAIKHLAVNNQEYLRKENNSVLSERALREIYLRAFELCVKLGGAMVVMTSYNAVNGIWTASNFDLVSAILRGQMGFEGMVMTDWWASMNEDGGEPSIKNTHLMVRSTNDIYMVFEDSLGNSLHDRSEEALAAGIVQRGDYILASAHILMILMSTATIQRKLGIPNPRPFEVIEDTEHKPPEHSCRTLPERSFEAAGGMEVWYKVEREDECRLVFTCESAAALDTAQGSVSVFLEDALLTTISWNGGGERLCAVTIPGNAPRRVKLYFPIGGLTVRDVHLE